MALRLIALSILLFAGSVDEPKIEILRGKVVGISDGDTVTVLLLDGDAKSTIKVRLDGIDAPESSQAFGSKAKDALRDHVAGKAVELRKSGEDRYGRTLATIIVGEENVNSLLVRDGWASATAARRSLPNYRRSPALPLHPEAFYIPQPAVSLFKLIPLGHVDTAISVARPIFDIERAV